ncbi:hypothetical protein [Microvirga tunisiensis]|uniref:Uncharacterized protein n=1 Tax=Microvirga tunisiensis TaxID=2108360 RepID=A0A5N7MCK9_9HYPH|nr:hypothetical protein [Microvirga tunisiensis]MPR05634.1 hypothetical protein [Microvirga tunisiensis]MPR23834.1 hypothetical protein [Microvirga tunisiensis]
MFIPPLVSTVPSARAESSLRDRFKTEACEKIVDDYKRVMTSDPRLPPTDPKNTSHRDLAGVSATVARHATLDRLLTIAWSLQCDLGPLLDLERTRINDVYIIRKENND